MVDDVSAVGLSIMLISTVLGICIFPRVETPVRWVLAATVFSILTEIAGMTVNVYMSNNIVYYIANPIEAGLIAMFFISLQSSPKKTYLCYTAFAYLIFAGLMNSFFPAADGVTTTYLIIVKGLIMTFLSIDYILALFRDEDPGNEIHINRIIISMGVLFYYSFSAIYFSINSYFYTHNLSLNSIAGLSPFLYVVYSIFQAGVLSVLFFISGKKERHVQ
ncbi:MAG: hypothetical protein INR69_04195 [Mucilaginibacter polytrichastri]|nr:hypothetical protein [Mucilaginibacter polytrichastri]